MSFLGNVFDFEAFNLKDMWGKLKDDPERIFLGAADPLSSKFWGEVTGKDYEPLVDQMGGAYGGDWISAFGNGQDGGVYGRAKEAGIDTKAGGYMHDAAHVLSAIFGGQGLMGSSFGSSLTPSSSSGNLGIFSNGGQGGMSGVGGGNAGLLAQQGGIPGGAGMGSATPQTFGMSDYLKLAQQSMPQQQQQQQTPPPSGMSVPRPIFVGGQLVWV